MAGIASAMAIYERHGEEERASRKKTGKQRPASNNKMVIAVDFDGTIVTHNYPHIGTEKPFALETLKLLAKEGHNIILWTVREGDMLNEAVEWCRERGLEFYAVNKDYPEETPENNNRYSRKLKVDVFIDDRNVGGIPDWGTIYNIIKSGRSFEDILSERFNKMPTIERKPRPWWQFWRQ